MYHKTALLLVAGLTTAQQGNYDLTCWVTLGSYSFYECVPCYGGQVQGGVCHTWNNQTCIATQVECCAQPGVERNICMDNWDECRGATSFDPSHEITNAQCLDWCRAKDPQFDANCGLESYDYIPTDGYDPDFNGVPDIVPWDTNKCLTPYGFAAPDCVGPNTVDNITTPGAQGCQDACVLKGDCCYWRYWFQCYFFTGGRMQDCTDIILISEDSSSPEDPDLCDMSLIRSGGFENTLECEGTTRCRVKEGTLYGPAMCFPGVDACKPGNKDVCHYGGGNNPVISNSTEPPSDTTVVTVATDATDATVATDTTVEEIPPC